MLKPNFIIAGVPKAGTTAIFDWLSKNPQIYMSRVKEPGFFAYAGQKYTIRNGHRISLPEYATCWDHYLRLFRGAKPDQVIGEATTYYFHFLQAPGIMKALIPSLKLVVILRNPIERMYSHYFMDLRDGYANSSFEEGIDFEKNMELGFSNKEIGMYARNLRRYLSFFPARQIYVGFYDDLLHDPASFCERICIFLDIDPFSHPVLQRLNDFGLYPYRWWRQQINGMGYQHSLRRIVRFFLPFSVRVRIHCVLNQHKPLIKPEMPSFLREKLISFYREDILELQDMVDRDLSHWLK